MRTCATFGVLAALAAGLSVVAVAGCASTEGYRSSARTSAASLRSTLTTIPAQVDGTMDALYKATSAVDTDRLEKHRAFQTRFSALKEDGRYIGDHARRARSESARYFKEWAEEAVAADPSKRAQMTPAIEGRLTGYETALSYLDGGRDSFNTLIQQLTAIDEALTANLSRAGSAEINKKVQDAKLTSVDLKSYSAVLSDRIDAALAKK